MDYTKKIQRSKKESESKNIHVISSINQSKELEAKDLTKGECPEVIDKNVNQNMNDNDIVLIELLDSDKVNSDQHESDEIGPLSCDAIELNDNEEPTDQLAKENKITIASDTKKIDPNSKKVITANNLSTIRTNLTKTNAVLVKHKESEMTIENIDIISISSTDSLNSGYNSSDFEFITQSEAEMVSFKTKKNKYSKKKSKKVSENRAIASSSNQNIVNESKKDLFNPENRAGPSHGFHKTCKNELKFNPTVFSSEETLDNNQADGETNELPFPEPDTRETPENEILSGNLDPLPHQNFFMEQKSVSFGAELSIMHPIPGRVGFGLDMHALVNRYAAPVDDGTNEEAEATKGMIQNLYSQNKRY